MIVNCTYCNKAFAKTPYQAAKAKKHFCSTICYGFGQRRRVKKICEICKVEFEISESLSKQGGRTCSRKCHFVYQSIRPQITGQNHHAWGGGRYKTKKGYIVVKSHNHPNKDKNNNVLEHILVVEKEIGRFLIKGEEVHHINEIKDDNRPENLMLFACKSDHAKYHWGHDIIPLWDGRKLLTK
jgi:hypothetical protein